MSFLYPRTISVRRQNIPAASSVGAQAFGGDQPANETVIASNVPASIQYDRVGRVTPSNLPATTGLPYMRILIPASALSSAAAAAAQAECRAALARAPDGSRDRAADEGCRRQRP